MTGRGGDHVDAYLLDPDSKVLSRAAHTLRSRRGENLEQVLPAVLDQMWQDGLRDMVYWKLSDRANPEAAAVPQPAKKFR